MQDAPLVAVGQPPQQLEEEQADVVQLQAARVPLHVLGQVGVHILEDEGEGVSGVHDVVQRDDVGVLQVLEQGRLPDGRERRALLLLQPDLLERHHLVGEVAEAFEDGGVGPLAQLLQLHVRVGFAERRITPEGGEALGPAAARVLLGLVEEHLRLGPGRLLGAQDNARLLTDVLVQQLRVGGHRQLAAHALVLPVVSAVLLVGDVAVGLQPVQELIAVAVERQLGTSVRVVRVLLGDG